MITLQLTIQELDLLIVAVRYGLQSADIPESERAAVRATLKRIGEARSQERIDEPPRDADGEVEDG